MEENYYYPFGEIKSHSGSLDVKYKFNGHEYDAESGLYYMGARYYDPKLGRFISADTVVQFPFYPQSLNRYSFTLNNPIMIRELDGHCGTAPSGFWSSVKSFFSSIGRAVASFARGAVSVAVSFARAGANIVIGGASLVAGVTVGVLTGGNSAAVRAVFSGADSLRGEINNGANNAIASLGGGGVGGPTGSCTNCMSPNEAPPGEYPELDYQSLFVGGERRSSEYGWRTDPLTGENKFHTGLDVAPDPNTGIGTALLAPSDGQITKVTNGSIYFTPNGFPNKSSLFFYHVAALPSLSKNLPIQVNAGSIIGTLGNYGRMTGAHVHIGLQSGGNTYNPGFVFH